VHGKFVWALLGFVQHFCLGSNGDLVAKAIKNWRDSRHIFTQTADETLLNHFDFLLGWPSKGYFSVGEGKLLRKLAYSDFLGHLVQLNAQVVHFLHCLHLQAVLFAKIRNSLFSLRIVLCVAALNLVEVIY
jgi:hypothetical protein